MKLAKKFTVALLITFTTTLGLSNQSRAVAVLTGNAMNTTIGGLFVGFMLGGVTSGIVGAVSFGSKQKELGYAFTGGFLH